MSHKDLQDGTTAHRKGGNTLNGEHARLARLYTPDRFLSLAEIPRCAFLAILRYSGIWRIFLTLVLPYVKKDRP